MKTILVLMLTVAMALELLVSPTSSEEADFKTDDYGHGPTETEIVAAIEKAREINLLKRSINLLNRGYNNRSSARCPLSFHHGTREHKGDTLAESKANDALLAVRILVNEGGYNYSTDFQKKSVRETFKRLRVSTCGEPTPSACDFNSPYRNADGSCNNIKHPDWGMTGSIQQRVRPNDYDDKLGTPRTKGVGDKDLPNPRTVSNVVHCNSNPGLKETLSNKLTLHVMGFGQFLDHDIAITPEQESVEDCCSKEHKDDTDYCFNIIIPKRDKYESSTIFVPGYCMEVKRSAPVFCPDGTAVREQTNGLTSFIDASNVYGSSAERQAELRESDGNGFRMKTTTFEDQERLPNGPKDSCVLTNAGQSCSSAGDRRVNEIPTLTTYHFLFVKEHNRIAEIIKDYYTNNETIFQETRRIVIAIMQKIVYKEFLPSFFSPTGLREHKLLSSEDYVYDPDTNPTLRNAFGIAYRVGHSWVPSQIQLFDRYFKRINQPGFSRNTEDILLNPNMTYLPMAFERLAYYQSGRQSPETDNVLEEAIRSRLFIDVKDRTAFDLAALNIQRGRDHGLPSYNKYRKWCGLSRVKRQWGRKSGLVDHTPAMRNLLELAGYKSPRDIDLFVGGLTEKPITGGNLGPTFECIIGKHFQSLKCGDRLWYQNKDSGFTSEQVSAIEEYSLSKVLCHNYGFKDIHYPSAFKSSDNRKVCSKIPDLDLSVFKPSSSEEPDDKADGNGDDEWGWWWGKRTSNNDKRLSDDKEDLTVDEGDEDTFNLEESLDRMIEELAKTRENRNR